MRDRWFRSVLLGAFLCCAAAMLTVSLGACNTVEGAGEDVEAAGEGISDASRDVRD